MKVAFLPYFPKNPYQRELAKALGRAGLSVALPEDRPSPLELFRRERFDVLHLHWLHDLVLAGARRRRTAKKASRFLGELLLLKALGTKLVWTIHNIVEHERRDPEAELLIYRVLTRALDTIIVHCDRAAEEVARQYRLSARQKIRIIRHGHYRDAYESTWTRAQARDRLGYSPSDLVFLHFGQLRPYKEVPRLVEAFGRLSRKDVRLLLVGSSPKGERLVLPKDDRIRAIETFVPDEDVAMYLRAADIAVLPFARVLTSGSLVLAMSFGLPVIAPRIGCLPETIPPEGGLFYEDGELASAMAKILDADRSAMGERNRVAALAVSFEDMAQETLAAYS
ncbi:MAG: glycosyltransferase family 4 protein [Deltaproteobacteria bacterium]|nr:glycosyltransferase family 4 protein [Deltaproteobacteria bacterium]